MVCLPKGESLDGSLTWRNKVGGRSCCGECMSDCSFQLLPSQEHGGEDLLPTDVFFKGETISWRDFLMARGLKSNSEASFQRCC